MYGIEPPLETDTIYSELLSNEDIRDRVIITPHTSYYSQESLEECRTKACQNVARILNLEEPFNRLV